MLLAASEACERVVCGSVKFTSISVPEAAEKATLVIHLFVRPHELSRKVALALERIITY